MKQMVYSFVRFIAVVLFKSLFLLRVKGRENIPEKGGCIVAGNHLSYLDPIVLASACPRKVCFLARSELFTDTSRAFVWLISAMGAFPLKKEKVDLKAIRTALTLLREGQALVMFPEGTRSPDGLLKKGEPGMGMLALKAGVPIIPALIVGTERALPREAKFIRLSKISVFFGKRITPDEFESSGKDRDDYQKIVDLVMGKIAGLKGRLT